MFVTVPLYLYYEVVACIRANSGEWYSFLPVPGPRRSTRPKALKPVVP